MYSPVVLVLAAAVILLASMVQGLVGFGFSQFSLPMLVLLLDSRDLIPIMVVLSLFLNIYLLAGLRGHAQPRRIWPLMLGGALGIPVGTYLLLVADASMMKLLIGIVIIIFGLALWLDMRRTLARERAAMAPIGFLGGVLNGSVSMSGPPLIIFFSNQDMPRDEFRANLICFFTFINLVTLPVFLGAGLLTAPVITSSALLAPGMLAGAFMGSAAARRIPQERFRRATLLLILLMGMMSVASGLGLL